LHRASPPFLGFLFREWTSYLPSFTLLFRFPFSLSAPSLARSLDTILRSIRSHSLPVPFPGTFLVASPRISYRSTSVGVPLAVRRLSPYLFIRPHLSLAIGALHRIYPSLPYRRTSLLPRSFSFILPPVSYSTSSLPPSSLFLLPLLPSSCSRPPRAYPLPRCTSFPLSLLPSVTRPPPASPALLRSRGRALRFVLVPLPLPASSRPSRLSAFAVPRPHFLRSCAPTLLYSPSQRLYCPQAPRLPGSAVSSRLPLRNSHGHVRCLVTTPSTRGSAFRPTFPPFRLHFSFPPDTFLLTFLTVPIFLRPPSPISFSCPSARLSVFPHWTSSPLIPPQGPFPALCPSPSSRSLSPLLFVVLPTPLSSSPSRTIPLCGPLSLLCFFPLLPTVFPFLFLRPVTPLSPFLLVPPSCVCLRAPLPPPDPAPPPSCWPLLLSLSSFVSFCPVLFSPYLFVFFLSSPASFPSLSRWQFLHARSLRLAAPFPLLVLLPSS